MMESDFYSDEFEQLIREKTEQYKMYPSEKVWKGIHGSLHTKRRWFIIGMSSLVIGILLYAGRELLLPSGHPDIARKSSTAAPASAGSPGSDENGSTTATSSHRRRTNSSSINEDESDDNEQSYKWVTVSISDTQTREPDISDVLSRAVSLPNEAPALPITASRTIIAAFTNATSLTEERTAQPGNSLAAATGGNIQGQEPPNTNNSKEESETDMGLSETHLPRIARNEPVMKNALAATKPEREAVPGDEKLTDPAGKAAQNAVPFTDAIADQQKANWLQDYAFYNLTIAPKANSWPAGSVPPAPS